MRGIYLFIGVLLIAALVSCRQGAVEPFQMLLLYDLPKEIWTHWDGDEVPDIVKRNLKERQQVMVGWHTNFITKNTMDKFVPVAGRPSQLNSLIVAHQADWLRLKLLAEHGGVWIDSGILLNYPESLNDLYYKSVAQQSELTAFFIDTFQSGGETFPVIENYFLMAPKGSEVVALWLKEFEKAIEMGLMEYRKSIEAEGVNTHGIYANPTDVYLTQHACLQAVLQRRLQRKPKVLLINAGETVFKIHSKCGFGNRDCIKKTLLETPRWKQPSMVKLRGTDRDGLELAGFFRDGGV